jgi:glycine cleavage system H lipoate-binding protein
MSDQYPDSLRYTKDHEWARVQGNAAVIGITFFAKDQLGDVVFLELPEVGAQLIQGKPFGVVESTKGWMIEVEMSKPDEAKALLTAAQYQALLATEGN